MAAHCGKCGAAWREGNRFCVGCGAPDEVFAAIVEPEASTMEVENNENLFTTANASGAAKSASENVYLEETDADLVPDDELAPLESCPSCAAPWRQGGAFCTKCGFTINKTDRIKFATARSEYASAAGNVPWPMIAVLALLLVGAAGWFFWDRSNNEQIELAAAQPPDMAVTTETQNVAADANPVDAQVSYTATQQLPVSGIYAGDIAGSRVFLSLNINSPQPLVMATGSARYQIGSDLVCDTVIAAASGTPEGHVRLEQRPSGNGKPCPKNYPIILDAIPGTTFSNGSADMLNATWLDPQNNSVLGTSILQR